MVSMLCILLLLKMMVLARYPNISPEGVWQFMEVGSVTDPQRSFHFTDPT